MKINGFAKFACLVVLGSIFSFFKCYKLSLHIAYKGVSPLHYIATHREPGNFINDFNYGISLLGTSLPMQLLVWFQKVTHISPIMSVYIYSVFTLFLFVISLFYFINTFSEDEEFSLIATAICLCAPLAGLNIARFGGGFGSYSPYLYYDFANAFRLFAMAFFFRNKYSLSALSFAVSSLSHFVMGAIGVSFVAIAYFVRMFKEFNAGLIRFAVILAVIVLPYMYYLVSISSSGVSVPLKTWVEYTKLFTVHLYPVSTLRFTQNAEYEFFPIITLLLTAYIVRKLSGIRFRYDKDIIYGIVTMSVLTFLGVIFSYYAFSATLIKLSLARASEFISLMCMLYFLYSVYIKMKENSLLVPVFIYSAVVFVFGYPGLPLLSILLILAVLSFLPVGRPPTYWRVIVAVTVLVCILIAVVNILVWNNVATDSQWLMVIYKSLWSPLKEISPYGSFNFLLKGGRMQGTDLVGIFFIAGTVVMLLGILSGRRNSFYRFCAVVLFSMSLLTTSSVLKNETWRDRKNLMALEMYNTQIWLKEHTLTSAYVLTSPADSYHWRDFSERSFFGGLREWLYSSILYTSDGTDFKKGQERAAVFGFKMDDFKRDIESRKHKAFYISDAINIVNRNYYNKTPEQLIRLAARYHLTHVIFEKKYVHQDYSSLQKVYENSIFEIYKF